MVHKKTSLCNTSLLKYLAKSQRNAWPNTLDTIQAFTVQHSEDCRKKLLASTYNISQIFFTRYLSMHMQLTSLLYELRI